MATQPAAKPDQDFIGRWIDWAKKNQRTAIAIGAVVFVVGAGVWLWMTGRARREAFAARELRQARSTAGSGNLPLATSDLSRIIDRYRGTAASEEAAIFLAQAQLLQGQTELAIAGLKRMVDGGPRPDFAGSAYALLGSAYEQNGQMAEAARAYEQAAGAYRFSFLKAQNLVEAGRTYWTAGDTTSAVRVYERVLREYKDSPGALEAQVRLAELRRGDVLVQEGL